MPGTPTAQIIDGKSVAEKIKEALRPRIDRLKVAGVVPSLTAILLGDDPGSETYVRNKVIACRKLGLQSDIIRRPANTSQSELLEIINDLNHNEGVHGILTQSPLPAHIDPLTITLATRHDKDVDGFHPFNMGMLLIGSPRLLPCTPHGIMKLLQCYNLPTASRKVAVIGRSNIVGKPMAALLMQKGADATVTVVHTKTPNASQITLDSDIVIAAIGSPNYLKGDMIKQSSVIIDVGINRINDKDAPKGSIIVGDVHFESCSAKAGWITPVPGGVGPMTIAMLMENTVTAAELLSQH